MLCKIDPKGIRAPRSDIRTKLGKDCSHPFFVHLLQALAGRNGIGRAGQGRGCRTTWATKWRP